MGTDILSFMPNTLNYVIRIFIAALCGFVIGYERKRRSKEAGIRTHSIVALGACLMMIISKYAFTDMEGEHDGARIAAQVVSGIGFIGTGMIVYSKGALHGLTTAAGIWATAGVGMAIGAGGNTMLIIGVAATAIIVFLHFFFHLPIKAFRTNETHQIQVQFTVVDGAVDTIKKLFGTDRILRMRMTDAGGVATGTVLLRTANVPDDNEWQKILAEYEFITTMEYCEEEWQ